PLNKGLELNSRPSAVCSVFIFAGRWGETVMAESVVLVAETREERGKQAARRLRRMGKVPAVVYGHKEETLSVSLPLDDVQKAIRRGVRVVDLKAGGKEEKALIRDVQWDHLGKDLLHVDFTRVAADERIVITIPLQLRGIA